MLNLRYKETPKEAQYYAPEVHRESSHVSPPCCGGNYINHQPLSQILEELLPANEGERAGYVGKMFGGIAIGVDGKWLSSNLGAGTQLEPHLRSGMEKKFGEDFSQVRIHTDDRADVIARTMNARAVAIGQHIVFAKGQFSPHKVSGRNLLVHELAHTVQQKRVNGIPSNYIPIIRPGHISERQADAVVQSVTNGHAVQLSQYHNVISSPHISMSVCGVFVEAACWASFSAIAAAIAALCTVGSVITVGGLAIPCTAVVIASAGLAAWDAVMCTNILKQEICGEPIAGSTRPAPAVA